MPKATVLEKYLERKQQLQQQIVQEKVTATLLWQYGELAYRISVLETCQAYCRSAPITTNVQSLTHHYHMLDAYIQNIAQERGYGPARGSDTEKERNAARTNLGRVIDDYRKRFASFVPASENIYSQEISKIVGVFLPVWLQMRETFGPLREEKKKEETH